MQMPQNNSPSVPVGPRSAALLSHDRHRLYSGSEALDKEPDKAGVVQLIQFPWLKGAPGSFLMMFVFPVPPPMRKIVHALLFEVRFAFLKIVILGRGGCAIGDLRRRLYLDLVGVVAGLVDLQSDLVDCIESVF
jgi:hypothetical protein